jgi:hypothetical protein
MIMLSASQGLLKEEVTEEIKAEVDTKEENLKLLEENGQSSQDDTFEKEIKKKHLRNLLCSGKYEPCFASYPCCAGMNLLCVLPLGQCIPVQSS